MISAKEAYERFLSEHSSEGKCSSTYLEGKYYIFSPDKYKDDFGTGYDYKVDSETGEISEYSYTEYLNDMKKYDDNTFPKQISLT